jgi:hypothetical protein
MSKGGEVDQFHEPENRLAAETDSLTEYHFAMPGDLSVPPAWPIRFRQNIDKDAKSFDRIDRSSDGGKSWEPAVRYRHAERNFITIDNTGGLRNR